MMNRTYCYGNEIGFEGYHAAQEMTSRHFVLCPVAPFEATSHTERAPLPRRQHNSYLRKLCYDTAINLALLSATFAVTIMMIF